MKRTTFLLATAAGIASAACSGDQPANDLAGNEADGAGNISAMANDPGNPFREAEMRMHERMTAAAGANASETWVRKMMEHHRGAIEMSDILLARGGDQRFLDKARMTADQQRRDIAELERMLSGGIEGGSGPANPFQETEGRMHDRMMAARGSNAAETWARKMIAHHQGAIDMSETLIGQGGDPEVAAMARRTADMQRREIAELENLLAGGSGVAAESAPSGPAATRPETREPAQKAKTQPRRSPPAPPEPKREDPHAGHDMNNMH